MRRSVLAVCVIAGVMAAGALRLGPSAADHGDAPGVRVDPRLDLPDVYAFQSPSQSGNVVFIMTMAPLARIVSQNNFSPRADHDFFVNTNADPDYEFAFNFRFGAPGPGGLQEIRFVGESRTQRVYESLGTTGETDRAAGRRVPSGERNRRPVFLRLHRLSLRAREPLWRRWRQHGRQLLPRLERHGDCARAAAVVVRDQQHRRLGPDSG